PGHDPVVSRGVRPRRLRSAPQDLRDPGSGMPRRPERHAGLCWSRPSGGTVRTAHRGRILVVDDEANARTALAELLRDEGYEVETAADAFKGLGKLEAFDPELILTDLKMPGMDGIELMARVAALREEAVPVVVMTAFGAVDTAVRAMRAGA